MWNGIIVAEVCFSIIVGLTSFFVPNFMTKIDDKNAMEMAE